MSPYSPIPRSVRGSGHHSLIQRLFRSSVDPDVCRVDLITTTRLRLSVIDSGTEPTESFAEGDTCIHALWQADEQNSSIEIGGDKLPIAPGDSTWIPAGDTWQLSPNQLAILVAVRSHALAVPIEPIHGEDQFVGHNRETIALAPSNIKLGRWKLTTPLDLAARDHDLILVALYADVAIRTDSGITMLHQGETSVIRPGTGSITLVPNGLSYVLALEIA